MAGPSVRSTLHIPRTDLNLHLHRIYQVSTRSHFHTTSQRAATPLWAISSRANTRATAHFQKASGLPITHHSPNLETIRASEVDPFKSAGHFGDTNGRQTVKDTSPNVKNVPPKAEETKSSLMDFVVVGNPSASAESATTRVKAEKTSPSTNTKNKVDDTASSSKMVHEWWKHQSERSAAPAPGPALVTTPWPAESSESIAKQLDQIHAELRSMRQSQHDESKRTLDKLRSWDATVFTNVVLMRILTGVLVSGMLSTIVFYELTREEDRKMLWIGMGEKSREKKEKARDQKLETARVNHAHEVEKARIAKRRELEWMKVRDMSRQHGPELRSNIPSWLRKLLWSNAG